MFHRSVGCFSKLSKLKPNKAFVSRVDVLRFKLTNSGKKFVVENTSNSIGAEGTQRGPYKRQWKANVNRTQHTEPEYFRDDLNDSSATQREYDSSNRRSSNPVLNNLLRRPGENTSEMKPVGLKQNILDMKRNIPNVAQNIPYVKRNMRYIKRNLPRDDTEAVNYRDFCYQTIVITEVLENEQCDWVKIASLFSEKEKLIPGHWTTRVMQTLSFSSQCEKALSLMEYIRSTGTPSIAEFGFLMKTLGKEGFDSKYNETILKLYDELKTMTDTFDNIVGIAVIGGISKTTRWKECLDILTDIEIICKNLEGHAQVAEAAFHYGDHKTGFDLLEKTANEITFVDRDQAYLKILENVKRGDSNGQMGKLLSFLNENNVIPSKQVANGIGDIIIYRYDFG